MDLHGDGVGQLDDVYQVSFRGVDDTTAVDQRWKKPFLSKLNGLILTTTGIR